MLKHYLGNLWVRTVFLSLLFFVSMLIFTSDTIRLNEQLERQKTDKLAQSKQANPDPTGTPSPPTNPEHDPVQNLIRTEHAKAIDEIKLLQEKIDTWYHYKFIFIGAVIALFLGQIGVWTMRSGDLGKTSIPNFDRLLVSYRTAAMLALACVIAFTIDMHIRTHLKGMQQLGQWVYHYVEPSLLRSADEHNPFIPWETFLRMEIPEAPDTRADLASIHGNVQSMHNNVFFKLMFSTQLHFMSIIIYMFYLIVFHNLCLSRRRGRRPQLAFMGFVFVHLTALAFIVVTHTVPDAFDVRCFPLFSSDKCWVKGTNGARYYLIAWLLLVVLNVPFIIQLFLRKKLAAGAAEPQPALESPTGAQRA